MTQEQGMVEPTALAAVAAVRVRAVTCAGRRIATAEGSIFWRGESGAVVHVRFPPSLTVSPKDPARNKDFPEWAGYVIVNSVGPS
mgnify:CR=1 FL=1